jgi:protein MpaA
MLSWPSFIAHFASAAVRSGFSARVLTNTPAGPLLAWERVTAGPKIYVSAGIHGDEPAGPLALLSLMEEGYFAADVSWAICPALNPTGLAAGARTNHQGHDLNRDYLVRVTDEVASHAQWLESSPAPNLFLSLHEDWETENFYLYEINTGEDEPRRAQGILGAVEAWFKPEPGPLIDDHTPRAAGWIYHAPEPDEPHGWPEAIFLAKYGCPLSFTFETPSRGTLKDRVSAQCAAVRAAYRVL